VSNHVADATQYAKQVVAGKIPACKWVRLACQRQLDDLRRKNFPYKFDAQRADKLCRFVELLPHIKGPKARTLIVLEPWQKFILCTVFGWVKKSKPKQRRFRRSYVEVPRGNAKSTLSSAIGLGCLVLDEEGGAEIYSAATTRDQAKIVFNAAQQMARASEGYRRKYGVAVNAHNISQLSSASKFEPLSAEANTLDGLNIHVAIVDELHAHRTREVYDVLETGTGKREQSLLWSITTAGSNHAGICYEIRTYLTKVLDKVTTDESFFGIIYTIDDESRWMEPAAWQEANPNWGVSVMPEVVAQLVHKALQMPSAQNNVKTKHLDIWCNADTAWLEMQRWHKCADATLDEADFAGQSCIVGLDLASKLDLVAKIKVFWKKIDGKRNYFVFGNYWTPEDRVQTSPNASYAGWVVEGKLFTCPGETNDYDMIEDAIRADCKLYDVLEVAHDPYQAQQFVNHLGPEGITMVEVPQIAKHLSEPMKELEAAIYDGRFHFDGNPVLTYAASNVVCHRDKNDNLFPTKQSYENKIDPVTALLTALNRVMATDDAAAGPVKFVFI
jgi:phage terminase large subunit-like protein